MSLFNQTTLYDISTKLQAQKQAHGECFFYYNRVEHMENGKKKKKV